MTAFRISTLALAMIFAAATSVGAGETSAAAETKPGSAAASSALAEGFPEGWYATIDTSFGRIVARLLPLQAPQSVAHFAAFADGRMTWTDITNGKQEHRPYYDGLAIHKIVPAERFEAGDPTGTGRGAPFVYVPIEVRGPIDFSRPYRLGLTRSAGMKVSGAMFFVTGTSQPYLTNRHPCVGEVVSGREVVDAILAARVIANGKPEEPITIESVRIVKSGNPAPLPDPVPYTPVTPSLEALPKKP